jgi:hypothetical protein
MVLTAGGGANATTRVHYGHRRRGGVAAWARAQIVPQGMAKAARIGWVTAQQAASLVPYIEAMRSALAELGYVEGRNLSIEFRYGDDLIERVPELAQELVRSPVDLIVAQVPPHLRSGTLACPFR